MRLQIVVTLACATLVGCGVSTDGAMTELASQSPQVAPVKRVTPISLTTTPGQVIVDGTGGTTLTPLATRAYRESGGPIRVELRRGDEGAAFTGLCAGRVDLVDSSRRISASELAACRAAGLTPVQFQVASDAVVVATKSGIDVGADCATVSQIRQMFRAGSPVYDWSQLGFGDAPLRVTGPDPASGVFRLFGEAALGSEQPGLVDLRSDYRVAGDRDRRHFIVGEAADAELAAQRPGLASRLPGLRSSARHAQASLRSARTELRDARRQVAKGIADGRTPAAKAQDRGRLSRATRALRPAERWVARSGAALASERAKVSDAVAATRRTGALRGRVGDFRFSYYELFEDQLRPLEVDAGRGGGRACVFPSRETVTDGTYPLSRQLLLTSTTAGMRRPEVQSFLGAYLADAQRLAARNQLIPLSDEAVRTERAWAAGTEAPAGSADLAGSGTVQ